MIIRLTEVASTKMDAVYGFIKGAINLRSLNSWVNFPVLNTRK